MAAPTQICSQLIPFRGMSSSVLCQRMHCVFFVAKLLRESDPHSYIVGAVVFANQPRGIAGIMQRACLMPPLALAREEPYCASCTQRNPTPPERS
jgi:hypothetical protein